ncbi:RAB, putative [Entamoeba invadens IP1]|uniref:RAB, putative n=1 Tax=Entamoeba invadens IP1 TaxID=370355 RepID=A0A0A1UA75_ENTIV|nr:RAB, putative [Entamoeba invadens IP1]ELP90066.1 RAB, putative [Entamoeba invadens IP1]|eukprot:XP_004256837.1 RAB, putative [Entamoeba invadens IP1]
MYNNLTIYKVCLCGSQGVGKTCLVNRYTKNTFNQAEKATIGANFVATSYMRKGQEIKLALWDTAGQEKYKSMVSMYYRGSRGAVIVYDVTNPTTFDDVRMWQSELLKAEPEVVCMLLGNKSDAGADRVVKTEDAQRLATELGMLYAEASAKTGNGVKDAFVKLFDAINLDDQMGQKETLQLNKGKEQDSGCC